MSHNRMGMIEACEKAAAIVSRPPDMERLYRSAIQSFGEGELRIKIMELALTAVEDENLKQEAFLNEESMVSFFCGIWIQFLLVETAGVNKEKLRAVAREVFMDYQKRRSLH